MNLINCAFYDRRNSSDQNICNEQIKLYCANRYNIVGWFVDKESGLSPLSSRLAWNDLLNNAKAGNFKLLLVNSINRLGRSPEIIIEAVNELKKYGVAIRSLNEPFDTDKIPTGYVLHPETLEYVINAYEAELVSLAFKMQAEGKNDPEIKAALRERGFVFKSDMLIKEVNCDNYKPIIDIETWEK